MHTVQKVIGDKKIFPNPPDYYQVLFVNGPVGIPIARFFHPSTAICACCFLNGGAIGDNEITLLSEAMKSGEIS